jgi:hypothetical protein
MLPSKCTRYIISDDKEELSNEHKQSQDIFRPHKPAKDEKASDTYAAAEKHKKQGRRI